MKLYYLVGACSLADHIVLEWTGAPYETAKMTHASIKSPEFLTLSPYGTVPVLTDGDYVLTQNAAILTYLADLHPDAKLLGDGTHRGRADVMRWLGFLNSDMHRAFEPIFAPAHFLPDPAAADALADTARANVRTYLNSIDRRLDDRRWLTGQRSVADPYLFVMLRWAVRLQVGLEGFANLSRFAAQMYDDDGVHAALLAEEGYVVYRTRSDEAPAAQALWGAAELRVQSA